MSYNSPSNYFAADVTGRNVDIKRHDREIAKVKTLISKLESGSEKEACRNILRRLESERAKVLSLL